MNVPEKDSDPGMYRISGQLVAMLHSLPKVTELIFPNASLRWMNTTYLKTRKRLANKLQNPRLIHISFHTFRHWKATLLYHQTKDVWYVKQFLRH